MSKFTQGPWRAKEKYGKHWIQAGKVQICDVTTREVENEEGDLDEDQKTTQANAKLIAAAPDMLAALLAIRAAFRRIPDDVQVPDEINTPSPEWDAVDKAIAKAGGGK